ncbi:TIGR01244 family sulfur transferase [Vibrio nitrifigilis]|uniref:TIGR01244 family phosphatase n=1 Tax=Vibrio nitrifigilis TaxID=2789781 RepID=A0ABS0GLI1_9VIBR|nr:TIGR01244 family sulfur transferase [Vibrio nitrifigilis]MBF9003283.1 TIGR01244 family phosphatase [Vibrio nitrifigilis]
MLDIKTLTNDLSVCAQIDKMDLKTIADKGFKTIICNRPDGEAEEQPLNGELEMLANRLGLDFIQQPVIAGALIDEDYQTFAKLINEAQKPILAFCRTGTRCSTLWVNGTQDFGSVDARLAKATELGFKIKTL